MTKRTPVNRVGNLLLAFAFIVSLLPAISLAQDATPQAPTAATPVGSPEAVTSANNFQQFIAGRWRIALVSGQLADEIPDLDLRARDGKQWLVVVADIVNWSDDDATLLPRDFAITVLGRDEPYKLAPKSTKTAAQALDLEPTDVDLGIPLDQDEQTRVVLVFQVDQGTEGQLLTIEEEQIPLDTLLTVPADFDNLPADLEVPELKRYTVEDVLSGATFTAKDADDPIELSFLDSPNPDECYGEESQARLERFLGEEALVEQGGDYLYVWSAREDGTRRLVNYEQIVSGYASMTPEVGGPFASWIVNGLQIAQNKPAGLWLDCTGPHGVERNQRVQRATLQLQSGEEESTYTVWTAWTPIVVATRDGSAWVFFSAVADSGKYEGKQLLYGALYDPANGKWQPAKKVPGGNVTFGPSAVVDQYGTVHVVYSSRESADDSDLSEILYTHDDGEGGFVDPIKVAPDANSGHQLAASLAIDAENTLYVLWQDQRAFDENARNASPANADIFASQMPRDGSWSTPVLVSFHRPTEASSRPKVVVDGDRLVAVWSIYTSALGLENAARLDWSWRPLDDEVDWSAPEAVTGGRGDTFGGRLLDLSADPTGGVVMVYARQGQETFLFLKRLDSGSTDWTGDTLVAFGQKGKFPSVAVNALGVAYVSYDIGAGDVSDVGIAAVPYESVIFGPEVVITRDDPNSQGLSGISIDVTGKPIIVFVSETPGQDAKAVQVVRNPSVPVTQEDASS